MKSVLINGKFFSQRVTGVQRYAIEIVGALDKLVKPGQLEIAIPSNAQNVPQYQNIQVKTVGHFTGVLWEQISFPAYALRQKKMPLNLCNASPLVYPGIICIHDVKVKACPQYFGTLFALWYRLLFLNARHRAYKLITVSDFSKSEIEKYYRISRDQISVIPSCWEHYAKISYDENAIKEYKLLPDSYYFALGSLDPNKNIRWIANLARKNQDVIFAIAGAVNKRVFAREGGFVCPPNMRFLGYVSDEEAKTLMRECRAFLFPSFYEGFGLPPLEALSAGAKRIVVSDIPAMHEVFGDAVNYINPYDDSSELMQIHEVSETDRKGILEKYAWEKSAKKLLSVLDGLSNESNAVENMNGFE